MDDILAVQFHLKWSSYFPGGLGRKKAAGSTWCLWHGGRRKRKWQSPSDPVTCSGHPYHSCVWTRNWIRGKSLIHSPNMVSTLCRLERSGNNACPLWMAWMNGADIILIPFFLPHLVIPPDSRINSKLPVTWIIHSFNYVSKMSEP